MICWFGTDINNYFGGCRERLLCRSSVKNTHPKKIIAGGYGSRPCGFYSSSPALGANGLKRACIKFVMFAAPSFVRTRSERPGAAGSFRFKKPLSLLRKPS
ncbi:MAG TPA: hypothetical protein DEQ02_05945, partial [Ruminococcaceae bacterium]|nr:hypothetical protein [Oscillospiraceae bacterium]